MRVLRYFFIWPSMVVFILLFSIISHEFGHVIGGSLVGQKNAHIYVWPGYEVFPDFAKYYPYPWPPGAIAFSTFIPSKIANKNDQQLNGSEFLAGLETGLFVNFEQLTQKVAQADKQTTAFIALMGSGFNLLIAMLCLTITKLFRPKGWLKIFTLCGALLFYDILSYSILPLYFDLPHLIFAGGTAPEPIIALLQLGINQSLSIGIIVLISLVHVLLIFKFMLRPKFNPSAFSRAQKQRVF